MQGSTKKKMEEMADKSLLDAGLGTSVYEKVAFEIGFEKCHSLMQAEVERKVHQLQTKD